VTAFCKAGFRLIARITIDTDVVRENNQTYRLGWSENAKDSSKMDAGMPEYVLVFRKLPTDTSDGYADVPVNKSKAEYTRADWQIDAAGIWRSSGNRLPDPEVMRGMTHPEIIQLWKRHCTSGIYSHDEHVAIAKSLEDIGHLPSTFMLFSTVSRNKDIWSDISRMLTLNTKQGAAGREKTTSQRAIRRASYLKDCDGCTFHGKCGYCPGISHAETGDAGSRSPYVCERTHLTMAALEYVNVCREEGLPVPIAGTPEADALFEQYGPSFAERQLAARRAGFTRQADALRERSTGLVQIEDPRA
jgi:hypothetical protein